MLGISGQGTEDRVQGTRYKVQDTGVSGRAVQVQLDKQGFKGLVAWQKAYQLSLDVYRASRQFPSSEMYGLTSQIRRAAVAIPANIAEGYTRQHRREYLQFLAIANASLAETETYLLLARDLAYLDQGSFNALDDSQKEVGKLLAGLLRSLRAGPLP